MVETPQLVADLTQLPSDAAARPDSSRALVAVYLHAQAVFERLRPVNTCCCSLACYDKACRSCMGLSSQMTAACCAEALVLLLLALSSVGDVAQTSKEGQRREAVCALVCVRVWYAWLVWGVE